ncbi:MAG: hypothetical protein ABSE63_08190 [Thermoguttaceae bacterium]|jgi:hypothetical protein
MESDCQIIPNDAKTQRNDLQDWQKAILVVLAEKLNPEPTHTPEPIKENENVIQIQR